MQFIPTELAEVMIVEPRVFGDERGFFMETYHRDRFAAAGLPTDFVQDNHSRSVRGTLRGLHYQLEHPQAKLCRVISGAVLDVAVDIRRGSPTFGRWVSVMLSAENRRQVFIPRGFAHGFLVLTESAEFLYKCDGFYQPGDDHGLRWDCPTLDIRWGLDEPLLSEKDRRHPGLGDVDPDRLPLYRP
jgi:dTDP-4-dehydrorhamnose 3,5-epimerase